MDHMRQGTLDTTGLRSLVLDEADEMLRMGFIDDVEWILEQLPRSDRWCCSRRRCRRRSVASPSVISRTQPR